MTISVLHRHQNMVLFAVLALALTFSCRDDVPSEGGQSGLFKVRLGIQDNAAVGLIMLAAGRDDYVKCGVDPAIVRFPSGKMALQAMMAGKLDMATCASLPFVAASFESEDIVVLATIAQTEKGAWIIARKDRGITEPEDLAGKRIATQKYSAVHFFLSMFLMHNYVPEEDVEIVFMAPPEMVPELVAGNIDAFCMRNPYIARAVELLGDNAVELTSPETYLQSFNLIARREYVRANPDVVVCMLRALAQAQEYAISQPVEAMQIAAISFGSGRSMEISADWKRYDYVLRLEQSLILTMETQARWVLRQRDQRHRAIPNYLDFIYFEGLEHVRPAAVDILH